MVDVWPMVAAQRRALADALVDLGSTEWDQPSLCRDWRTQDVLAHLVWLAELDRPRMFIETTAAAVRHLCSPLGAMVPIARGVADASTPHELLDRLRAAAAGRFVVPGVPPAAALAEVLVHGLDITRAVGRPDVLDPVAARIAVESMGRFAVVYGAPRALRRLRLTSTSGWSLPGSGGGELTAGDGDLLLLAAGRLSPDDLNPG